MHTPRFALTALLAAALAACGAVPPPPAEPKAPTPEEPTLEEQARLTPERALLFAVSRGLLYISETDATWTWADAAPGLRRLPTEEEFVALASLHGLRGQGVEVETRDARDFFARLKTVHDPRDAAVVHAARRYATLERAFFALYREVRVYRVRDAVHDPAVWKVYVLGENARGVSGLWTLAVET